MTVRHTFDEYLSSNAHGTQYLQVTWAIQRRRFAEVANRAEDCRESREYYQRQAAEKENCKTKLKSVSFPR